MGNTAKLVLLNEDHSPFQPRTTLFEAKDSIPVFWFALFSAGDIHAFTLPLSDGSSLAVSGFCAPLNVVVPRLVSRTALIKSWLPTELHRFFAEFCQEVERQTASRVGLDPAETALMSETDEQLQAYLLECLGAFEAKPEALADLFDLTGLEFDADLGRVVGWDDRVAEFALRGYR